MSLEILDDLDEIRMKIENLIVILGRAYRTKDWDLVLSATRQLKELM